MFLTRIFKSGSFLRLKFLSQQLICVNLCSSRINIDKNNLLRTHNHSIMLSKNSSDLELINVAKNIVFSDLTENKNVSISDAFNRISTMLDYNATNIERLWITMTLKCYKILANPVTSNGLLSAAILGWCVELMYVVSLIIDDLMDESITRWNKLCWYKRLDVGILAANNAFILQSRIYRIMKRHFCACSFYLELIERCIEITEKLGRGVSFEGAMTRNYEQFNMDNYFKLAHKTSHVFEPAIYIATILTGKNANKDYPIATEICLKLGLLYQIQDDYLDCFEDPNVTGSVGTDIVEGKCTWLAIKFLENANNSLKREWMDNYGKSGNEAVSKIVVLYKKVNLPEKFMQFEQDFYAKLKLQIDNELTDPSFQNLCTYILEKIIWRKI